MSGSSAFHAQNVQGASSIDALAHRRALGRRRGRVDALDGGVEVVRNPDMESGHRFPD